MITRTEAYRQLVTDRRACRACATQGYVNQSVLGFDSDEVGNYSTWANDLQADVLIVGQDFSNVGIYLRDKGQVEPKSLTADARPGDYSTATNYYLRELTKVIGRDIGLPNTNTSLGVFLTNAVLCMKPGAMNAANPTAVVQNCGMRFLKPLIELIRPKAIVTLGAVPAAAVLRAFNVSGQGAAFGEVFRNGPYALDGGEMRLFPMYHPGRLGQVGRARAEPGAGTGWDLMRGDWARMAEALTVDQRS